MGPVRRARGEHMPDNLFVNSGDPSSAVTEAGWNARADRIDAAGNLVVGDGIGLSSGTGQRLSISPPVGFWAKLSNGPQGNQNPYGFAEMQPNLDGTFSPRLGGFTGKGKFATDPTDLSAYEVNNITGLAGKLLWLVPGAYGDFRGQYIAKGFRVYFP